MGEFLSVECNPLNECNPFEDEDEDEFYLHKEARILSNEEYEKYYGRDEVETDIISEDESEELDMEELYEEVKRKTKIRIKQKELRKEIKEMKKNKKDKIVLETFDEDISESDIFIF